MDEQQKVYAYLITWLVEEWKVPKDKLEEFFPLYLKEYEASPCDLEDWLEFPSLRYGMAGQAFHKMIAEEIGESNVIKDWNWAKIAARLEKLSWNERVEDEKEAITRRNNKSW